MRIGVDATSWLNRRGFGRFARNVVSRLIEIDHAATYVLFFDAQTAALVDLPPGAERRAVALRETPARAATADGRRSTADVLRLTVAVRRCELDAFLFPSIYTFFPVLHVPTIVGVHDAIAHQLPELTLPTRTARAAWWAKERLAIRGARRVFTVSHASQAVLAAQFGLRDVPVVPEAPDSVFGPRTPEEIESELTPLGLTEGGYLFYAGGISPHKNLETLLDGYVEVRRRRSSAPPLVLAGDLSGDPYLSATTSVRRRIEQLGLGEHVLLPGFVSDECLACLYAGATLVILPSLAEGFGLPAVEAAACGAPVVLSDLAAHRESLADGAAFFPPRDPLALADVTVGLLDDPQSRAVLAQRGVANAGRLSWDRAALRLRDVVHEAIAA